MTILRRWLRGGSPGQTVIFFALMMTLIASFSALTIDVGLIVNERRDAQNDVDKAALAGAQELTLDPGSIGADTAAATIAAQAWAASNGIDLTDPEITLDVDVVYNCFSNADPVPTGVQVTVLRPAPSVFVGILGIVDWEATATATACAGLPIETAGTMPWAVSEVSGCFTESGGEYTPNWGASCQIVMDSSASGLHGELGLGRGSNDGCDSGNGAANGLKDNIIYGGVVNCRLDVDYVQGNNGFNAGPAHTGIETRLSTEGACDDSNDGNDFEDFEEVFTPLSEEVAEGYTAFCNSPRDLTLIVVHDWANPENGAGNKTYLVRGFLRMYLEGCSVENNGGGGGSTFYEKCDWNGNGKFTVHAMMVNAVEYTATLGATASFGEPVVFLRR